MPVTSKKSDPTRALPRNLPGPGVSTAADYLLSGSHLEDCIFADLNLSGIRISALAGTSLLFDRCSFANAEISSAGATFA